jgi:hypothetical protein
LAATVLRSTRIKVWRVSHVDSQPLSQMTFELEYLSGLQFTRITLQTSQVSSFSI